MRTAINRVFARTWQEASAGAATGLLLSALFLGTPANATDLSQRLGALPDEGDALLARPQYDELNWSGLYFGVGVGYGAGDINASGERGLFEYEQDGSVWSAFIGRNWQQGNGLFGFEADIATGNQTGSEVVGGNVMSSRLNTMGSVRARLGLITGPALMVYGTAGFAFADMDLEVNGGKSRSQTFFGYQVGAGAEFMVSSNWTLRAEYLYTDLSPESVNQGGLATRYNPDFHTIRAGVALKF